MGSLLNLRLQGTILGQQVITGFDFAEITPEPLTGVSFALATAFGLIAVAGVLPTGTPFDKLLLAQHPSMIWERFTVRTLYSVTDFYEAPLPANTIGKWATATDTTPPFMAMGLRSNRVRTDVRPGSKRLAGLAEGMVGAAGDLIAGALTTLNTFGASISTTLTATVGGQPYSFQSAVLPKQTPDDNVGQIGEYWPTYAAQLAKSAIGLTWTGNPKVRSQVSRQFGRGA